MGACFFLHRWAFWAYTVEGGVIGTAAPAHILAVDLRLSRDAAPARIDYACASLPVVLTTLNHAVEILSNEIGVA